MKFPEINLTAGGVIALGAVGVLGAAWLFRRQIGDSVREGAKQASEDVTDFWFTPFAIPRWYYGTFFSEDQGQ